MGMNGRDDAQLLIFDADDTLWQTEVLYDQARDRAADLVAANGVSRDAWVERQKEIDLKNVQQMGLSRDRFPTSSVQALEELGSGSVDPMLKQQVWEAAASVFSSPATLLPSVLDTLHALAEEHTLVLLTKGDRDVQHARIRNHEIVDAFDGILIVESKNSDVFSGICQLYGFLPSNAWSIGNSVPSDIVPAHKAGLRTIWLDAYVWAHERRHDDLPTETIELDDISSVLDVIGQ